MLTIPALCWLCASPLALAQHGFCSCCTRALLKSAPVCPRCGLPALSSQSPCGRCIQKPPLWQHMVAVGDYHAPLKTLAQRLKFRQTPALAAPLARLMLLRVLQARRERALALPELLVSVPLHRRRQWRRGYNQSALLAQPLAHWLGCRYETRALTRIKSTALQHRLSARLRARNLKNAFQLDLALKDRHIAIVDDIVTTGSTATEVARLLKRCGAASLQVWCLCRTL
ncbi:MULTISPECIES: DNA utilization protein GntX [Tenebrionibacter/Tenebrionicola group]|jgi:ComF family protein|uniref:DNA utilization protein GntX n=1 Tax=Tenebrionibacter intestinalis TaxID=2799638 RepID=A0A8K0XXX4_9ENTR|nr:MULTISPECIES: DNA utilization protein GntX [Tenebrionibacter/Tenebrionicola group]MBK4716118.1 DNA utilization protein GntX [Tenebrionibacter intestinalis]MBV4413150.1 DNA utilization protein GntX [Tenebrionicola larvae]